MSVYEEIYLQLDHISSLYLYDDSEMCVLTYTCEDLTSILDCLGNNHLRISRDVKDLFNRCIGQMCVILLNEENDDVKNRPRSTLRNCLAFSCWSN